MNLDGLDNKKAYKYGIKRKRNKKAGGCAVFFVAIGFWVVVALLVIIADYDKKNKEAEEKRENELEEVFRRPPVYETPIEPIDIEQVSNFSNNEEPYEDYDYDYAYNDDDYDSSIKYKTPKTTMGYNPPTYHSR